MAARADSNASIFMFWRVELKIEVQPAASSNLWPRSLDPRVFASSGLRQPQLQKSWTWKYNGADQTPFGLIDQSNCVNCEPKSQETKKIRSTRPTQQLVRRVRPPNKVKVPTYFRLPMSSDLLSKQQKQ